MTFTDLDDLEVNLETARIYEHGWQSWSPTASYAVRGRSPRPSSDPALAWQHPMSFRPEVALPDGGFQGEGLLVVDPGTGEPARLYAATDPTVSVPTLRARVQSSRVVVSGDQADQVTTAHGDGLEAALAQYGEAERDRREPALRRAPSVWCSWYDYFEDVAQSDIVENLDAIDRLQLPVDVVQVDDGWQAAVGDWLELSPRFASMRELADRIRDSGRRAGLWVAPFTVAEHSRLAVDHPDWLIPGGGSNWGGELAGLDLSLPAVRDHLRHVFGELRDAGFDYFKLDFVYTGALPGRRSQDVTEVAAYRSGLELVRDAVGADAYLVGCGAPILPSIGLVDAMRVSPDTYHPGDVDLVGELRGQVNNEARAWQHGRWWVNDGDCVVARPAFPRREEWAEVVERNSGLRAFSDRVSSLDDWGLETVRRILGSVPEPVPFTDVPTP